MTIGAEILAPASTESGSKPMSQAIEVSVVMPCLNEADTLATCIKKATNAINRAGISAEIIIADNGSTDGSIEIAKALGARVVHVKQKGYGHALMGGIAEARGEFIIMGDADDSYDFEELEKIVEKLREGYELVQGCRLPGGGGRVLPGAMPFLHRWWGNPMFTILSRIWFKAPVHDIYSGYRGFRKTLYKRLDQRCTGMEFATEMIIKASLHGAKIGEVPITLHPDGRKAHAPHLKTFRDGWRTLRFYMLYSPRWLFLIPAIILFVVGLIGYAVALPGLKIAGATFDVHTLLFASVAILCGHQALVFALFTRTFAVNEGLLPRDVRLEKFFEVATLERSLICGAVAFLAGIGLLGVVAKTWIQSGFGPLEYARTMRWVIPGALLSAGGLQTIFSSFFLSILSLRRK